MKEQRAPDLFEETEGGCMDAPPQPCQRSDCRHHVAQGLSQLRLSRAHHEETCVLKLADEGERTLAAVGEILGITRERVRQIETSALTRLARRMAENDWSESDIREALENAAGGSA